MSMDEARVSASFDIIIFYWNREEMWSYYFWNITQALICILSELFVIKVIVMEKMSLGQGLKCFRTYIKNILASAFCVFTVDEV